MIIEIKWNNHPVLGNLVLKLTKLEEGGDHQGGTCGENRIYEKDF